LSENKQVAIRRKQRYSHIYIALNVKIGFQWKQIKALDWHDEGFNFFIEDEISYSNLLFKKGQAKFAGQVKWCRKCDDKTFNLEMTLNTLLYDELNRMDSKNKIFDRIVKVIRTDGMIDEKKKILEAINPEITESEINRRIREQKQNPLLYRYGVKVSSPEWAAIEKYALEASSVVDAIDKVGKGLSQLADNMDQEDSSSFKNEET
jgi:hypothetical protein